MGSSAGDSEKHSGTGLIKRIQGKISARVMPAFRFGMALASFKDKVCILRYDYEILSFDVPLSVVRAYSGCRIGFLR